MDEWKGGRIPVRRRRRRDRSERDFELLVKEAVDRLPPQVRRWLDNVDVVIEEEASDEEKASAGHDQDEVVYGLYQGTPLTDRSSFYGMVLPDKITIYRGTLMREFPSRYELRREVRQTIVHEFAHHFGLSDDQLDELGI